MQPFGERATGSIGSIGVAQAGSAMAPDIANREAFEKQRAQQLYAMNSALNGQERQARLQVLGIAVSAITPENSDVAVELAEEMWAFVTAGDQKSTLGEA